MSIESVQVGDELGKLEIEITRTLIVAGAIASRDYQDVHHDGEIAKERGSKDIFMNILTTNGLVGRYVTDWAGPNCKILSVAIRLGVPNYPGDTMLLTGHVVETDPSSNEVLVEVTGSNSLGNHVTGQIKLVLPKKEI
jgi:acyl dehydratase